MKLGQTPRTFPPHQQRMRMQNAILFASLRHFCTISLTQSRKILSKFSNLSAILKHKGKNFEMMTSIDHRREPLLLLFIRSISPFLIGTD